MTFKFAGKQNVFITKNGYPVTIIGRTEFFIDREPRYCVESIDGAIPGKNVSQDWINQSQLTDVAPVIEKPEEKAIAPVKKDSGRRPTVRKVPSIRNAVKATQNTPVG